jgi:hypothetical protein
MMHRRPEGSGCAKKNSLHHCRVEDVSLTMIRPVCLLLLWPQLFRDSAAFAPAAAPPHLNILMLASDDMRPEIADPYIVYAQFM